jgi:dephospho-CoA kinase
MTDDETDFVIIDVDGIAHDILLPGKLGGDSIYHRLVAEFGSGILEESDKEKTTPSIDRRKLGDIVFRDRQKRKKLKSITQPKIIKIMLRRL